MLKDDELGVAATPMAITPTMAVATRKTEKTTAENVAKIAAEERFKSFLLANGIKGVEGVNMLLALRGIDDLIAQCDNIGEPLLRTTKSSHAIITLNHLLAEPCFKKLTKEKRSQYLTAAQEYMP